jgi:hypothetical protein
MTDLSGSWLGTYWQDGTPTRFELTLLQGGNTLSGNILDDNYLEEATLVGEVIGRRITFTKTYISAFRHRVDYTGVLSEEGDFMQGQWQIISSMQFRAFTGNWEAHRQDDNLSLNLEVGRFEKVPVSL